MAWLLRQLRHPRVLAKFSELFLGLERSMGFVILIDTPRDCKAAEIRLEWNQVIILTA